MATTATPKYFPEYEIDNVGIFTSGGSQTNNATDLAFTEALRYGKQENDVFILSLGSGSQIKALEEISDQGLLFWSKNSNQEIIGTHSANVNAYLRQRFVSRNNEDNYYRWQTWIKQDVEFDNFEKNNVDFLLDSAHQFFEELQVFNDDSFTKLIRNLTD
jgi:hypothetical protein